MTEMLIKQLIVAVKMVWTLYEPRAALTKTIGNEAVSEYQAPSLLHNSQQ